MTFETILDTIKNAIRGKDVRQAIYEGLDTINKKDDEITKTYEEINDNFSTAVGDYGTLGNRLDTIASENNPVFYNGTFENLKKDNTIDKKKRYCINAITDTNYYEHVVFWNGTAWIDGGEYGQKIKDGSINYFKTNFIQSIENINILNITDDVISGCTLSTDGSIVSYNAGWYISGFSLVKPNTTYFKSYMERNAFAYYDENYQFLQFQRLLDDNIDEITTPNNPKIRYVRCQLNGNIQNAFMLEKVGNNVNLINITDYISNKVLTADGNTIVSNNMGIMGYCNVENGKIYYLKRGPGRSIFCLYDKDYNYIEGYQLDVDSRNAFLQFQNIPNLKYLRFNLPDNSKEYVELIDMSNYFNNLNNVLGVESYSLDNKIKVSSSNLDLSLKEKMDLIQYDGENKINYNEFIKGKLYDSNGEFIENNNAWTSNLVEVTGEWCTLFQSKGISLYGNTLIWDKEKNLIGNIPTSNISWISSRKMRVFFFDLKDAKYISFTFNVNLIGENMPILVFEKDIDNHTMDGNVKIEKLKIGEQNLDDEIKQTYHNSEKAFENSLDESVLYRNFLETDEIAEVYMDGDMTSVTKEVEGFVKLRFIMSKIRFQTYAKIKWQGTSSLSYPKKNFTIKLFHDVNKKRKNKMNVKWGKENKYCLKANYMDHSHARNIVSARIWGQIVNSRSKKLDYLLEHSPNFGAIDGFPVKVYINNEYQGLYTWNIPKDGWMFGMDEENPNHAVLCAEQNNGGNNSANLSTEFRAQTNINGDWSLEFPDELNPNIKSSFNNLISCVKDSTDEEFVANIETYLDLESAIDYYLYAYFGCFLDSLGKNMIMMTYDGIKWICSMYDMDSTWGIYWNGSKFVSPEYQCPNEYQETNSLLWQRLVQLFPQKLYDRYKELRETVLSEENLYYEFEKFMNAIPGELYEQDVQIYTGIPQKNVNHLTQIKEFITARAEYVDGKMEELNTNTIIE